jgi:E3 ubiquitin-protein ligase BRE1
MKEYKRQKKDLEENYSALQEKCQYHDDHLRVIDAFFAQMLDEVRVLASHLLPTPPAGTPSASGMRQLTPFFERG